MQKKDVICLDNFTERECYKEYDRWLIIQKPFLNYINLIHCSLYMVSRFTYFSFQTFLQTILNRFVL